MGVHRLWTNPHIHIHKSPWYSTAWHTLKNGDLPITRLGYVGITKQGYNMIQPSAISPVNCCGQQWTIMNPVLWFIQLFGPGIGRCSVPPRRGPWCLLDGSHQLEAGTQAEQVEAEHCPARRTLHPRCATREKRENDGRCDTHILGHWGTAREHVTGKTITLQYVSTCFVW